MIFCSTGSSCTRRPTDPHLAVGQYRVAGAHLSYAGRLSPRRPREPPVSGIAGPGQQTHGHRAAIVRAFGGSG